MMSKLESFTMLSVTVLIIGFLVFFMREVNRATYEHSKLNAEIKIAEFNSEQARYEQPVVIDLEEFINQRRKDFDALGEI